jgi:UDP-3-O-[3-hydroxymyristoyl] glucosamine N-acyltransferase
VIGEGVRIGEHCRIYPGWCCMRGRWWGIGWWCMPGRCWGRMGLGMCAMRRRGRYTQFPQQGRLVIEDDVEIGANTTIDRGALARRGFGGGEAG